MTYRHLLCWLTFAFLLHMNVGLAAAADTVSSQTVPSSLADPQVSYDHSLKAPQRAQQVHTSPLKVYSHPVALGALAFSMDGRTLAVGDAQGKIWFWPLGSEELVTTLDAHRRGVKALAFHPDGTTLASGGGDGTVHVWNVRDARVQAWLDVKHRGPVTSVAFSPDGTRILSGSQDDSILVRDVVTGQKLATFFGHSADVEALVVAPESDCAISGGNDRSLQGWDLGSAEQLDFSTQPARVTALALSPDGTRLAAALSDGMITLRRTTRCRVHTVALRMVLHTQPVRALVFSHDGKWLFSAGEDRQIIKWDVENGIPVESFQGHQDEITALSISPDDALLASAGRDKVVRIWKLGETRVFEPAPSQLSPGPSTRAVSSSRPVVAPHSIPMPPPAPPATPEPAGPSPD